jgi:hypothetical protein
MSQTRGGPACVAATCQNVAAETSPERRLRDAHRTTSQSSFSESTRTGDLCVLLSPTDESAAQDLSRPICRSAWLIGHYGASAVQ